MYALAHQHAFEFGRLAHELLILLIGAEAHDPLDAGTVVPGAVEEDQLAGRGQVLRVTLKEPLPAFEIAWLFQRHHVGAAWVQVFHEALDGAALACRVATFEQDHDTLARILDPGLEFEQFDLQAIFLPLVAAARHQVLVRIATLAPVRRQFRIGVDALGPQCHPPFFQQAVEQGHGFLVRSARKQVAHGGKAFALSFVLGLDDRVRLDAFRRIERANIA